MAKQTINIGLAPNDGNGDPIRDAFDKVNDNFTELYNFDAGLPAVATSGDYGDLQGLPTLFTANNISVNTANTANTFSLNYNNTTATITLIPGRIPDDLTDLGIADGANGTVLTTDGSGNFRFLSVGAVGGGGIALTDLSVGTPASANSSGALAYNNTSGVFTYTPPVIPADLLDLGISDGSNNQVLTTDGAGNFTFKTVTTGGVSYADSDVDAHLNTSSAANNEVLSWNGTDYDWVAQSSGSGGGLSNTEIINLVSGSGLVMLPTRTTKTGTTTSLADGASGNLDITGFKSYGLMSIQTDKAAWVRIYTDDASRTADASRAETTDPTPDAGVVAEVITTGASTILVSPGVFGFNNEATPTTTIPCAVKNKSGSTATVQVTLKLLQLEA